ncbi:putative minus-end-directed kinesin ATPase [Helianthus annuus]|uniref:Minus-end-directed kinesin ATPase n=1 Tax=Helianthus annuus TaxID=4232 RepID=A0A9K3E162_HELAN|nr:putative minus-end-directed kinesin ATPase [Helianthus annuus]KAJ0830776.1 putative minus-end-directed kinesin ATPase [Helianthus annuus]
MSNNNRWNWEVSGFEPRKSPAEQPSSAPAPLVRRYSISTPSIVPHSEAVYKQNIANKLHNLKDKVKNVREDYAELRQEAVDLQEYSNAKLDRVTRYLGVLADKTRKLDQAALEAEAKVAPLIEEKKRLYNELLTTKGNIKVFCRTRPLFEDEGSSVVEFPDDFTIRVNTGDDTVSNPKKDYEFDRVYGPHIGQAEVFTDVQPFVQSALDGHNVSIFAYGQTCSGKTHTMEGSSHDRGLYVRCFEELFDVSNSDTTSTSRFNFFVTVVELHNEQTHDLLSESESGLSKVRMGSLDSFVDLVQEKVDNPLDFSKLIKKSLLSRNGDNTKINSSHLIITIHIYYDNLITGENIYSKLSLVDLAGSESLGLEDDNGEQTTDMLHVMKSLSALGDVLASLTSNKEDVPYENSMLTKLLADSLGGSSKTLLIVNICPNASNLSETLSSLNFSARARNTVLSLGNRDTIKKWKDIANDARKEYYEKEKQNHDLKQEVAGLKQALKVANDQCVLLFNEVQKAWKVSFTLQSDLKAENIMLAEKHKIEKDQNNDLRNQVAPLLQQVQDQKLQIQQHDSTIETLQAKLKAMEAQLKEASENKSKNSLDSTEGIESAAVTKKLEEELLKRDALIERLHEENEKLFERLTEKASSIGSQQALGAPPKNLNQSPDPGSNNKEGAMDVVPFSAEKKADGTLALVKQGQDKIKSTPAGEYLTSALNDFDLEHYDGLAAISDGANKLLMLVLAAVIKAGASREHEILAEIRDAVFSFIRKMEPHRVMDTMLVSRVRILYIRSLLARSPELQSIKVPAVERFLEKPTIGHSRSSSRGSSPGRSPGRYDPTVRNALILDGQMQGFRVNIKPEKKSKLSSVVLKIRGIDQESWRQHVTGAKLREITDDAKAFATGNKALAALFVHTPAGELQRQIRSWLAMNFDFLSVSGVDAVGGATGQLELLSTAIMDGWMAGLGAAMPPVTDALGQLLVEYAKRVYNSQLQHLKDIAGTLATEAAEDSAQVAKLRSALESVDHKRRKASLLLFFIVIILQQMKGDNALLTLEDGGSPIRNPSSAAEDARLASLIALDNILKQIKEIKRQSSVNIMSRSKKKALITSLDDLSAQLSSLLEIDHPCAQRHIADARRFVESVVEEDDKFQGTSRAASDDLSAETDVAQWNVLQFNTGSTNPFIIKCGANSHSELVIKADDRVQEPKGGEIVRVVPRPTVLENMSLEEIKEVFSKLPEALSLLALARTADGTRARYSRLYRTLAMKVPALRDLVGELEKGGGLKDVKS